MHHPNTVLNCRVNPFEEKSHQRKGHLISFERTVTKFDLGSVGNSQESKNEASSIFVGVVQRHCIGAQLLYIEHPGQPCFEFVS